MTKHKAKRRGNTVTQAANRLLPVALLDMPLARLGLAVSVAEKFAARKLATVGDLLALSSRAFLRDAWFTSTDREEVQRALGEVLRASFGGEPAAAVGDWSAWRDQLLAPLEADERTALDLVVAFDGTTASRPAIAARLGISHAQLDDRVRQVRARLHERVPALLGRLRYEIGREMQACDGLLDLRHAAPDSILRTIQRDGGDMLLGARLATFCFPREFHLHRGFLYNLAPSRFRRLLRTLPRIVCPQRLPLAIDTVRSELANEQLEVPRGLLLHLLKKELRIAIEQDPAAGEMAAADPRSAHKRLVGLLLESGKPMQLDDLVFDYRERFRRASRARIEQRLRSNPTFLMLGPETWSLRDWHRENLLAVTPLAERTARRICTMGGRQNIAVLLASEKPDDRTIWLVLDRLAADPRVRLLGRGDACPATHRRSQVLEQLLTDFRRAAGDVVLSMFVGNQPPSIHRLVQRLLRWNRLFVMPAEDRIDLLSNYPFDEARLRHLVALVDEQLQARSGYANTTVLKAAVDRTELGGGWLTPALLADLLRRHGPFEVLPGDLVARRDLAIGAFVMRAVRQALREVGGPLSVDEILHERPDLAEFAGCLRELLAADPLVQSPDGDHFTLA